MTEQDYVLFCIGMRDKELNELRKVRFLAWNSYIGPHQDTAKMHRSIVQFFPIGDEKIEIEPIPHDILIEWDKKFRALA